MSLVGITKTDAKRIGTMLRDYEGGRLSGGGPDDQSQDGGELVGICLEKPLPVGQPTKRPGDNSSGKFLALNPNGKTSTIVWLTDGVNAEPTFQLQVGNTLTDEIASDADGAAVLAAIQALENAPEGVQVLGPGSTVSGEEWPTGLYVIWSDVISVDVWFVTENSETPAAGGSRTLRFQPTRYVFPIVEYWSQDDPWIAGRIGFFRSVPGVGFQLLNRETWGAL